MTLSFRVKTILGIAVIEALFLFAILVSSMSVLAHSNEAALHARAASDTRLFAAANALVSDDVGSLHSTVQQVARSRGVLYSAAWDAQGRLLAASGHPAAAGVGVPSERPVQVDRTPYGTVEVVLSRQELKALLRHARRRILAIAVTEMLLVGFFSWLLGSYLMRQIAALEHGTARIATGEFGFALPVHSRDELGRMTVGFKAMSARLQALQEVAARQHDEVLALNAQLEARVEERTTALATANRELEYRTLHDPLTGLPNRLLLQDRLLQAIRRGQREQSPFALLIMDLDGFKDVNDTRGHSFR